MTIRTLAVLATLALPMAAQAETVTLKQMEGATVHHATVDMSVYWTKGAGEAVELVAYYAAKDDAAGGKLQMALVDGDSVTFGLPGHVGQMFTFAREGDVVSVATTGTSPETLAMN
ncbi:hypothetical protein [Sagittula sp. S175]|uniref:hypothetical protein n=1 Tax=Sagittula sp. S175 TaxID=3415129 RepID=UPI003C7A27C1